MAVLVQGAHEGAGLQLPEMRGLLYGFFFTAGHNHTSHTNSCFVCVKFLWLSVVLGGALRDWGCGAVRQSV